MNKSQAETLLRHFAPGCIRFTKHCSDRMMERNVTMDDILHVLMWVDVVEVQEDSEYQDWKCKVEGVDTDGNELVLLSAIDKNERSVLCMTVF